RPRGRRDPSDRSRRVEADAGEDAEARGAVAVRQAGAAAEGELEIRREQPAQAREQFHRALDCAGLLQLHLSRESGENGEALSQEGEGKLAAEAVRQRVADREVREVAGAAEHNAA